MPEERLIDSLKPHPINEQIYGDTYDHELISSIKKYGFKGSIEVTKDDIIVSGHRRWFVMQELEYETIPVTVIDIEDPDELISYLIKMNQSQRKRNNLQIAAEFGVLKDIEERRATERMSDGGGDKKSEDYTNGSKPGVVNLPHPVSPKLPEESNGKARDKAAEKLNTGWSGKKAENALKVKNYADGIKNSHPKLTKILINLLNDKSVNAAFNKMKIIKKELKDASTEKARIEAEEKQNKEMAADLEFEPEPVIEPEPVKIEPDPEPIITELIHEPEPEKLKKEDPVEFFNPDSPPEPKPVIPVKKSKFNKTNDNIEWAKWSWNPVTGCLHDCQYCYARDIAVRYSKGDFSPKFHEDRLNAPQFTNIPQDRMNEPGIKNVFVCSMADLFGKWVDASWIQTVIDVCREQPQWTYLFLTKNPERYLEFEFPDNCWIGASATDQTQFDRAVKVFKEMDDERFNVDCVKFLSCEPLNEAIHPYRERTDDEKDHIVERGGDCMAAFEWTSALDCVDWLIIGGRSESMRMPAFQPEWSWVQNLIVAADKANVPIYFKPNLTVRPTDYPKNK